MTEDDLFAIERLLEQRSHLFEPADQWSAGMTKAMLDKIPELVAEVRLRIKERKVLVSTIEMSLETFTMDWLRLAKQTEKTLLEKVKG